MKAEILEIQSWKALIKKYYKPVIWFVFTFLLGYYFSNKGGFLVIGNGKNVEINVLDDMCIDTYTEDSTLYLQDFNITPQKPEFIAIHCSANKSMHIDRSDLYFLFFVSRGWSHWGYNYFVQPSGEILALCGIDKSPFIEADEIVNGVAGWNSKTISIAYSGGIDRYGKPLNTLTEKQKISIQFLITQFKSQFKGIKVRGHRDFPGVKKACPSLNVAEVFGT